MFIVIDEAHCIIEWGEDFRPCFKQLSELRSVFPDCNILALSATVSQRGVTFIKSNLKMIKCVVVSTCPSKDNISITVLKKPPSSNTGLNSYKFVFEPIILELKYKGAAFPLTIVYCCGNLDWVGFAYQLAQQLLGKRFYAGEESPEKATVAMFHASMDNDTKV